MSLSGRVVAITGASAGIGRACAERFANEGASVAILARRADRLQELTTAIEARGGRAIAVPGDVTIPADCRRLVSTAVDTFGRLDAIVCNAGVGFHAAFGSTPDEVMRRLMDVNVMGTLYAAHAALEVFGRQRSGHVVAVSSIVGRRGTAGSAVYAATKAAQLGFIEGLRAELAGSGIYASVVFPVGTATEFHDAIHRDYGQKVEPVGPRQSADDVARAIGRCLESPRAEVYPYPRAKWLAVLSVIAPSVADRFVARYGRRVDDTSDAGPAA